MVTTKLNVFIDMDGVLCNFVKKYQEAFGCTPKEGWASKHAGANWKKFCKSGYFQELEPMPDMAKLVTFLSESCKEGKIDSLAILSSAGGEDYYDIVKKQKEEWLRNHQLDDLPAHIVVSGNLKGKVIEHSPDDNVLIDDTKHVIEEFEKYGGIGIRFKSADQTIQELEDIFRKRSK
jgi:hypothetical protein